MQASYRPKSINLEAFYYYYNNGKFDNIVIKKLTNVTVPSYLMPKICFEENVKNITFDVKFTLNSLTNSNTNEIKKKLKTIITKNTTDNKNNMLIIKIVTEEILNGFLKTKNCFNGYLTILNLCSKICVRSDDLTNKTTFTIGKSFIIECRNLSIKLYGATNIKRLASILPSCDGDDDNKFNEEKDEILNLTRILCSLYNQRTDSSKIKLIAEELYPLINKIIDIYIIHRNKFKALPNPYNIDYDDDAAENIDELIFNYEVTKGIVKLYSEIIYVFMENCSDQFISDTNDKNNNMSKLVDRFKNEVIPTLIDQWIIIKSSALFTN
jgi:hypothetical protein